MAIVRADYRIFVRANTYTISGPTTGPIGTPSAPFIVTPNGVYTGTISIALDHSWIATPSVLTWVASAVPQTFTISGP